MMTATMMAYSCGEGSGVRPHGGRGSRARAGRPRGGDRRKSGPGQRETQEEGETPQHDSADNDAPRARRRIGVVVVGASSREASVDKTSLFPKGRGVPVVSLWFRDTPGSAQAGRRGGSWRGTPGNH
ncbi:uncharacterized protein LOC144867420 [Branchiostoma floridae x Branchiostoma japonicum]